MVKNKIIKTIQVVKGLYSHPLGGWRSIFRFIRWQFSGLLLGERSKIVKWFGGARIHLKKGMHGMTGNYYVKLLEFEDMAFLLHFLREQDLFMDVGANVGAYSILASYFNKCRSIVIEPISSSFRFLCKNVDLNNLNNLIESHNVGVSSSSGRLFFTTNEDTTNHVIIDRDDSNKSISVYTLDHIANNKIPLLLKIVVEGYEWFALEGATG
ncbi:MAG: FkbM family methyltransferase, partial [Bacteroidota bacterium]